MTRFEAALSEIERQGLIVSNRKEDKELLLETLVKAFTVFADELKNIDCIFTYRQGEQAIEKFKNTDGNTFYSTRCHTTDTLTGDGLVTMCNDYDIIQSLGVSVEALQFNRQYAAMVFMHELAHVLMYKGGYDNNHDGFFHNYLTMLILKYNAETGENVKNDYYGLDTQLDQ